MTGGGTRERLVEAALRLFAKQGFEATSVGEIEADSGLSPRAGGFYRHFENKAAILSEVLDKHLVETPGNLGIDHLLPLGDTRAELLLLGRAYLRVNTENRQLSQLIERESQRDPALRRRLTKANAALFQALSAWLKKKKAAAGANAECLRAAVGIIFGGWLFVLTKHAQQTLPKDYDLDLHLDKWASFWSTQLDSAGGAAGLLDRG